MLGLYIKVDKHFATVAIAFHLKMGKESPTSVVQFKDIVRNYLTEYGNSCIDAHEGESQKYLLEATIKVVKYFNH